MELCRDTLPPRGALRRSVPRFPATGGSEATAPRWIRRASRCSAPPRSTAPPGARAGPTAPQRPREHEPRCEQAAGFRGDTGAAPHSPSAAGAVPCCAVARRAAGSRSPPSPAGFAVLHGRSSCWAAASGTAGLDLPVGAAHRGPRWHGHGRGVRSLDPAPIPSPPPALGLCGRASPGCCGTRLASRRGWGCPRHPPRHRLLPCSLNKRPRINITFIAHSAGFFFIEKGINT